MKSKSNSTSNPNLSPTERAAALSMEVHKTRKGKARWDLIGGSSWPPQVAVKQRSANAGEAPCGFVFPPYSEELFGVIWDGKDPEIIRPPKLLEGLIEAKYDFSNYVIPFRGSFASWMGCLGKFQHSDCPEKDSAIRVTAIWKAMGEATVKVFAGEASYAIQANMLVNDRTTGEFVASATVPLISDSRSGFGQETKYLEEDFQFTEMIIPWWLVRPSRQYDLYFLLSISAAYQGFWTNTKADIVVKVFGFSACCQPPIIP